MNPPSTEATIAAGAFGAWLEEARESLHGNRGSDVPCGDCVGCCVSSYFIPVRPEDKDALDTSPARYLVNAPNEPRGQWLMGYREDGTCPMLSDNKCTILNTLSGVISSRAIAAVPDRMPGRRRGAPAP